MDVDIDALVVGAGPVGALVVAGGADDAQVALARQEARELGAPLEVVRPAGVPVAELYRAELTLVRPDQHVAWRGARWQNRLRRALAW